MGAPIIAHLKKGNSTPTMRRMKPSPMTLGGVPMGVASPPMEAENDVISMSAVAKRGLSSTPPSRRSYRNARMLRPMANIMAVVAVFDIQAEVKAVTAPKANRMRLG